MIAALKIIVLLYVAIGVLVSIWDTVKSMPYDLDLTIVDMRHKWPVFSNWPYWTLAVFVFLLICLFWQIYVKEYIQYKK